MKKTILICAVLTMLGTFSASADEEKTTTPNKAESKATITPAQRQNMASMHEKMATCLRSNKPMSECRTEMRKNCQAMMAQGGCPMMGEMGMGGTSAAEPPKNVISMDKAEATALKKYPGTLKSSELEREDGRWVYSFDVVGSDKNTHEVWVDAKSGKIVKHKIETAGEEAAEEKGEHED